MINFDRFRNFDRIRTLDPREQQRQYWIFRNDVLNPLSRSSAIGSGGAGAGSGAGGGKKPKPPTIYSSSFSFFTIPGEQFVTSPGDIILKSSTGYIKAFYPYDLLNGIFGTGDPNLSISIEFTDTTPWNGVLPFLVYSCDVDGNSTGQITYLKFDNLSLVKSLNLTYCKDDLIEVDLAGCVDLESVIIPSSVSLVTLNVSNTKVQQLSINGCEYLETLDITSTLFESVYTLDLTGITNLITIVGDNCNLFGMITSANTIEEISLNDCGTLSSLICNDFSGNGGLGRIQIKNCSLGPGSLDILYTSLGSANGTNNTIYVYGNPGIGGSDPLIATNKGFLIDTNP